MTLQEKIHRIELLLAISLFLVLAGIISINFIDFSLTPSFPEVTGFVSSDPIIQNIDLNIIQSQKFILTTINLFNLTSFRLSGSVNGQGPVQIFLEDELGERLLVYTNMQEKKENRNLITGLFIDEKTNDEISFILTPSEKLSPLTLESDDLMFKEGEFDNKCFETCFMNLYFSEKSSYKLVFLLGEGVQVHIERSVYTIK